MPLPDRDYTRVDRPIEEIDVHDGERAPATLWQMLITALLAVAILTIFFYGVTEQREEAAGVQSAVKPDDATPAVRTHWPKGPATTGQGTE